MQATTRLGAERKRRARLQAAIAADCAAAGGHPEQRALERSPSSLSKRSNSGAVRIGSGAAATSAASSPGTTAAQQVKT